MRLNLDRLDTTPREESFEGDAAWWAEASRSAPDPLEPRPTGPARFALRAHKMGEDVYVEGEAEAPFEFGCSRCLARYRERLREPFRVVLEPAGGRVPPEPEGVEALSREGVWLGEELDAGWYRGSEIDLGRYLREVVALALPVQPLCREDCRGLCPRCGIDRNRETCSCQEASAHSPFAVLRRLKTESTD